MGRGWGDIHIVQGVTVRFDFDILRTSQLHLFVKNKATGTPHGMFCIQPSLASDISIMFVDDKGDELYTYIIRGAFGVARFDEQGNAKAFRMWNE